MLPKDLTSVQTQGLEKCYSAHACYMQISLLSPVENSIGTLFYQKLAHQLLLAVVYLALSFTLQFLQVVTEYSFSENESKEVL